MKSCKNILLLAFVGIMLSSCGNAVVNGTFDAAPSSGKLLVKSFEGDGMRVIDTIEVKGNAFTYTRKVQKGQPEFIYLFNGDTKVASLLLSHADKLKVECDTLGNWTVSGSEDCEKLRRNEMEHIAFISSGGISAKQYVDYYHKMTKYVLENTKSLTVIPVLFSKVGQLHVFGQITDAIIFNSVVDSLASVYPDSKYLAMLRQEAATRTDRMKFEEMVRNAGSINYPELNLPDVNGVKTSLSSSLGSKATMVVFWSAAEPLTKIYNQDVLKPIYNRYHDKGLEIYSVNISADKSEWAMVVSEQNLPWVNVCDPSASSAALYGIAVEPSVVLLWGDNVEKLENVDAASLNRALSKAL